MKTERMKFSAVLTAIALVITIFALSSVSFAHADGVRGADFIIDDFDGANKWLASHNIAEINMINQQYGAETRSCLEVRPDSMTQEASVISMFGSSSPLNIYDYSKVSYKLYIANPDTPPEAASEQYTVVLTLHSGTHKSEHRSKISTGVWYTITADIGDWFRSSSVNAIEITVYSTSENTAVKHGGYFLIDTVAVSGTSDKTISETFLSSNFEGTGCNVTYSADKKTMTVSSDSSDEQSPYIKGNIDVEDRLFLSGYNAVRIVLENGTECESMKLEYASESDSEFSDAKGVSTSINKYGSETSYLLYVSPDTDLDSLKLTFSGSWEGDIKISAISLVHIKDGFSVPESRQIGNISKCELSADGKYISIKGTISSDMAVKYIDCRLNLYEIPSYGDVYSIDVETEPVMSVDMSTRFEFKLPIQGHEIKRITHKYVVTLVYQDEIVFIDNPKYVTSSSAILSAAAAAKQNQKSIKGFHDSGITGVFESACSHIVIDISCESLLIPRDEVTGAGKLHVRDGYYYYFNSAYISYLDDRIKMYSMSGSEVVLRLVSESNRDTDGLAFHDAENAVSYAFNTNSPSSINQLCAIVDYLSMRYNGNNGEGKVSGFIVGKKADVFSVYNNAGSLSDDIYDYAKSYADSLRIVYSVAYENISDIKVYASTGSYVYRSDSILLKNPDTDYDILTGVSASSVDPSLFIELLCRRISEEGAFPWYLMNEASDAGDSYETAFNYGRTMNLLITRLSKRYLCVPVSSAVFWQPEAGYEPGQLSVSYRKLFNLIYDEKCAESVILSTQRQRGVTFSEILPMLKSVDSGNGDSSAKAQTEFIEKEAAVLHLYDEYPDDYTGVYNYWNFTQSYDSQGWFAGEGASSVSTGKNAVFGFRTLNAEMTGAEENSCCVMIWAVKGQIKNLSRTPVIETEFIVSSKESDKGEFEVVIVFGSDKGRAEYTAKVTAGIPVKLLADISEFSSSDKISYAAVMVRGEDAVSVNLSRISGYSGSMSNAELKAAAENYVAAKEIPDDNSERMMILAAVSVGLVTLSIILLLSRKKED